MTHVLDILEELKSQIGKGSAGRKMDILLQHKDNDDLKDFFYWCLEPSINYWQSKITKKRSTKSNADWLCLNMPFREVMESIDEKLVYRSITGNKAKDHLYHLYLCLHNEKDKILLERIITGKPDVGFNIGTVNKVWPGLVYDPAYMRCKGYSPKLVEGWDFENEWIISQLKADGMFDNLMIDQNSIRFETRSGEDLSKVVQALDSKLFDKLCDMSGYIPVIEPLIHGELLVEKDGVLMERSKGNGIINKVKLGDMTAFPKDHILKIVIWDYIPKFNFDNHVPYEVPYVERMQTLLVAIDLSSNSDDLEFIEYRRVKTMMEAQEHFVECLQAGFEGTVLKNASRLIWKYHDSPNQLKLKNKFRFEMKVTGFTKGEGKYKSTFGSMIIESECGGLISAISGMTDKIRNYIHANRSIFMDAVVEVEANGIFKNEDGSFGLMHPRFKELRTDKTEADTLERIIQQEIDSIMGKRMEHEV